MKKRVLSLLLALLLTVSIFVMPVQAATAKQAHAFLKRVAQGGSYDSDAHWWYETTQFSDTLFYGVYYLEQTDYIELTVFDDDYEVTWRISGNPSPAYNAFVQAYQDNDAKGTVQIQAGYNATDFSSFRSYEGDTARSNELLAVLNERLPMVMELTRMLLNTEQYTLADLGLTGYRSCRYFHIYDDGKVTRLPTCVTPGIRTYTCKFCGAERTDYINPTNEHTWDEGVVVVSSTCTRKGVVRYTCTVCKAINDVQIPELGHIWKLDQVLTEADESGSHGTARFICKRCGNTKDGLLCAAEVFTDMPVEGNWAHKPIDWAYFSGVTSGKTDTSFEPKTKITRAEAMTFLWTAAGKPTPSLSESPFTDVKPDKYYYKAVLWAVEKGITGGTSETGFSPKAKCSRAEIMTFLWKAAGKPEPTLSESPFQDVRPGKYYYKPILWAYENHVTGGTEAGKFSPKAVCTRAQVVTFLYKVKDLLRPAGEP